MFPGELKRTLGRKGLTKDLEAAQPNLFLGTKGLSEIDIALKVSLIGLYLSSSSNKSSVDNGKLVLVC